MRRHGAKLAAQEGRQALARPQLVNLRRRRPESLGDDPDAADDVLDVLVAVRLHGRLGCGAQRHGRIRGSHGACISVRAPWSGQAGWRERPARPLRCPGHRGEAGRGSVRARPRLSSGALVLFPVAADGAQDDGGASGRLRLAKATAVVAPSGMGHGHDVERRAGVEVHERETRVVTPVGIVGPIALEAQKPALVEQPRVVAVQQVRGDRLGSLGRLADQGDAAR